MDSRRFVSLALSVVMVVACNSVALGQQYPQYPFGEQILPPRDENNPFKPVESLQDGLGITLEGLPDDRVFFKDENIGMTCLADGPIHIELPVTRYVGPTSGGRLIHHEEMVQRGLLSPKATLVIAAFDVDEGSADTDLPRPPGNDDPGFEFHPVKFNGEFTGPAPNNSAVSPLGVHNKWSITAMDVDIANVKFPERGVNGAEPTPAINTVEIEIDAGRGTGGGVGLWCLGGIDWVALHFRTVSPIILMHGINSNGGFFDRQGFAGLLRFMQWPFDGCENPANGCENPISLQPPNETIALNGESLSTLIPPIVRTFGVNSVHLIGHSKGGLDLREYLARHQPDFDQDFKVLSYTSLSTPHKGSVLADFVTAARAKIFVGASVDANLSPLATILWPDPGTPNLTTDFAEYHNSQFATDLPTDVAYRLVAADADQNISASIDILSEMDAHRKEEAILDFLIDTFPSLAILLVDEYYQLVANYVSMPFRVDSTGKPIVEVEPAEPGSPRPNDTFVWIDSGLAASVLNHLTPIHLIFGDSAGKNHSSIADRDVAERVLPWIQVVDQGHDYGDLQ